MQQRLKEFVSCEADIDYNQIIGADNQFMLFIGYIAYRILSYDTVHTYKDEKPQISLIHL